MSEIPTDKTLAAAKQPAPERFAPRKLLLPLAALVLISAAAAGTAAAFSHGLFAKVSPKQAAATAVARTGGYAEKVKFKYRHHSSGHYKVETLTADGHEFDVLISAENGKILAVREDFDDDRLPARPAADTDDPAVPASAPAAAQAS